MPLNVKRYTLPFFVLLLTVFNCSGQVAGSISGGNITISPALLNNFQPFIPSSGGTTTVTAQVANEIFVEINPAGLLGTLTIAFPAGDHVGQVIRVNSTQVLTLVTMTSASGTVVNPLASYVLNGYVSYYWDGTNWCRCG